MDMFKTIYELGIIPVVAINDADDAVPLAKALIDGGLPAAEITFRTAAAEESIRRITAECPDVLVGAGTVLTPEQCDRAIAAGDKNVYYIPGAELMKYCGHDGTVDISHPTDHGFASMAKVFGDLLEKIFNER